MTPTHTVRIVFADHDELVVFDVPRADLERTIWSGRSKDENVCVELERIDPWGVFHYREPEAAA